MLSEEMALRTNHYYYAIFPAQTTLIPSSLLKPPSCHLSCSNHPHTIFPTQTTLIPSSMPKPPSYLLPCSSHPHAIFPAQTTLIQSSLLIPPSYHLPCSNHPHTISLNLSSPYHILPLFLPLTFNFKLQCPFQYMTFLSPQHMTVPQTLFAMVN